MAKRPNAPEDNTAQSRVKQKLILPDGGQRGSDSEMDTDILPESSSVASHVVSFGVTDNPATTMVGNQGRPDERSSLDEDIRCLGERCLYLSHKQPLTAMTCFQTSQLSHLQMWKWTRCPSADPRALAIHGLPPPSTSPTLRFLANLLARWSRISGNPMSMQLWMQLSSRRTHRNFWITR